MKEAVHSMAHFDSAITVLFNRQGPKLSMVRPNHSNVRLVQSKLTVKVLISSCVM